MKSGQDLSFEPFLEDRREPRQLKPKDQEPINRGVTNGEVSRFRLVLMIRNGPTTTTTSISPQSFYVRWHIKWAVDGASDE